jgi:1D-myo-inositol-tetrakisphosphate 5-kinase/inositol-polyphosphate multikinase
LSLSVSALREAFINYLPFSIPDQLRNKLIDLFLEELKDLEPIIKSIPMRMYGSSILFVYEGDLIRLEKLLNGKNVLADNIEIEENEEAQEEEDEDEEDEEDDYLKYSPVALKLIDFAHTTFHDGKPDDEGYWLGLENTIKNFEDLKSSSESI